MSGIRIGDVTDIDEICDLASELLKTGAYANIKPDEQKFRLFLAGMMGIKKGIILLVVDDKDKPQGFLFGVIEELFFSRQKMATDLAIYVRKEHRNMAPNLLRTFVKWAQSKTKMSRIILGISSGIGDPRRTGKMYERLGFNQVGGIFMKQVERIK